MNILYILAFIFVSFSLSSQTDTIRKKSSVNSDKRITQTIEDQTTDSRTNEANPSPPHDKVLKAQNSQSETNAASRNYTTEEPNYRRETKPKKQSN